MKKIMGILLVLTAAIALVSCGSAPQTEPTAVEEPATEEATMSNTPLSQLSYDKGREAIDIMFDYQSSHDGDTATQKLQAIQAEINDEEDFVSSYMNIFIADIILEKDQEEITDQITFFEEELARRMPK